MKNDIMIMRFLIFAAVVFQIIALNASCARIRNALENTDYLTPIPFATMSAYQLGQPVETRLEAVTAARRSGMLGFHMEWTSKPEVIYAEKMGYKEALKRIGETRTPNSTDMERSKIPVWLVVFKGEWRSVEPLGTLSAPYSGCAFVVISAEDGSGFMASGRKCEEMDLEL